MTLYIDKLNFYELYNSVRIANEEAPQLGLGSTLASLEERYSHLIESNEQYLSLNQNRFQPKFNLIENRTQDDEQQKIE